MAIKRSFGAAAAAGESAQAVPSKMEGRVVLGIDPGTNFMGYGVIRVEAGGPVCVVHGVIRLDKLGDPYRKLAHIFERVTGLIASYRPDEVALEAPFFGVNVQSMLKLGRAQGVAMAAALARGIDVFEYAPTAVKQSIGGGGRASKEQVAGLVGRLLGMSEAEVSRERLDATDALAVALCHYLSQGSPLPKKGKSNDWSKFLASNPDKVVK